MYKKYIKRTLDLLFALLSLMVLSPLLLVIFIWLHFANKGSGAFFIQERPGKGERIFKLYKFKSMTDERDSQGNLLPDAKRLTRVGRFVRRTSLDELPQLWNVLKGDMSLIGPRPLLVSYLPLYTKAQARRHLVRPGISGWAQVNGRNAIAWEQKFEFDTWYVDNLSVMLDLKVIVMTIRKVFKQDGISSDTSATIEAFRGSKEAETPKMKKIAIYGAGGLGREVDFLIQDINSRSLQYDFVGYFDDGREKGEVINAFPVLGGMRELNDYEEELCLAIAIANPSVKKKIVEGIGNKKISFPALIHPSVCLARAEVTKIGRGCIICAGGIITVNVEVKDFVALNPSCTVGHDTVIGQYSSFMPGVNVSGNVEVEDEVYIGTGATVINQLRIGEKTIVGAGAVVVKSLPANCTAVGVPAKPLIKHT